LKEFKKKKLICNKSTLINRLFKQFHLFLFINLILIAGCSNLNRNEISSICLSTKLPCLLSTEYVLLITNKGKIKLELYGNSAPITVGNFIDYVEKGKYDKTIFNRVIKEPYPFIIRGGADILKEGDNKFIEKQKVRIRYIPLEIKLKTNNLPTYGKKIDTTIKKNNIELKHKRSYLSMARTDNLNSASFQFYISLKPLPELDGSFAVFGKVIEGMNVVDLIEEGDFIVNAKRL
tara:strand:- start:28 stop:729 length:702 start_codon:yes stop_codon:yes gene_type:complete